MAISNHSWEWKRVMFMVECGGVKIRKAHLLKARQTSAITRYAMKWHVLMPEPHHDFLAASKWQGALKALSMLGVRDEFLPDAAKTRAGRPPVQN